MQTHTHTHACTHACKRTTPLLDASVQAITHTGAEGIHWPRVVQSGWKLYGSFRKIRGTFFGGPYNKDPTI